MTRPLNTFSIGLCWYFLRAFVRAESEEDEDLQIE
jgi:hypothetical protein